MFSHQHILLDDFPEDDSIGPDNQPWRRFTDADEYPNVLGDLVADLEQRYAQTGPRRQRSPPRPLKKKVSVFDDILLSPRHQDTPLWRVRCRVRFQHLLAFLL